MENPLEARQVGEVDINPMFTGTFDDFSDPIDNDIPDDDIIDDREQPVVVQPGDNDTKPPTGESIDEDDEDDDLSPTDDDEIDLEGYSEAAVLAMSLKNDGLLPEDIEVDKEWSFADLRNKVYESGIRDVQAEAQAAFEKLGEAKKFVDFILQGGDPATLQQAASSIQYSRLKVEGESDEDLQNRETILKAMYYDKGLGEEEADKLVRDLVADGKDIEKAVAAKQYFKQKEDYILEQDRIRREQQLAQQREELELRRRSVSQILKAGKAKDVEIDRERVKDYEQAFFEPTETITYVDQNGNQQRAKVTKLQKLQHEFEQSIESQVAFAILLLDGFDLNKVKQKAADEYNDKFLSHLNRSGGTKKKKTTVVSRQVGTYS